MAIYRLNFYHPNNSKKKKKMLGADGLAFRSTTCRYLKILLKGRPVL